MNLDDAIEVDISLWPIVRCAPRGVVPDEAYAGMFLTFEKLWDKGERFLTVTDTRMNESVSARQRQLIGAWVNERGDLIKKFSLGSIIIVDSAMIRGALTAIGWVAQPDLHSSYVSDWSEASSLASQWLETSGHMTEHLRQRLRHVS